MPKSHKQKTAVRGKKNPTTKKKKAHDVPAIPLLEEDTMAQQHLSSEIGIEDFADVSEERASIISIVRDLEGQVDTAYKLKEVLEAELDTAQKKLSEEAAGRMQLEQQVKSLQEQAALAEQLREDICFAEEERNKFANSLAEVQQQLKAVTKQRDSFAEQTASAEKHTKKMESEKTDLEAHVMNLKDQLTDINHLRDELAKVKQARQDLEEQVRDLSNRLETSNMSRDTLEKDLAEASDQVENLREKLVDAENRTADLLGHFEQQQATNKDLKETNKRLENETKTLNVKYEAAKNELKAFKKAIYDIRNEATQTSGRVRQRYFKPTGKE